MVEVQINIWAVLLATVLHYILGAFWYSPLLFGKFWLELVGQSAEDLKKGAVKAYIGSFLATLVMAYVLAHFVQYAGATTLLQGATAGFWAWLGFVATTSGINMLYQNKPWKLYLVDVGYFLAGLIIMGAVLGVWQ